MSWSDSSNRRDLGTVAWAFSWLLLLLPSLVLAGLAVAAESLQAATGAAVVLLFLVLFARAHPVWQPPVSVLVVVVYLIAAIWAWAPFRDSTAAAPRIAQGLLLLCVVLLFAFHELNRSGAEPRRRANRWSRRIKARTSWPAMLADCRTVPEALGLRSALREEPGPALALLTDPRLEVQTAALGALEHRINWRPGEAEVVLKHAVESPEPVVRAAAVYALAGVSTADLVSGLASFLRDPAPEVRAAAAESLLWDGGSRWPFARDMVKQALADSKFAGEGPLFANAGRLPGAAVADLIAWSAEHPPLAGRAIRTVSEYFNAELNAADRPELANELATMMLDNATAPALRVELASLLRDHHMLTPDLLDRLTNLNQPAPIRLFAAELMLRLNPHDPDGVDVLRGLARQPNRELALQVAAVLQNVLGLDVGIPSGQIPAANSKLAADVTRRVLAWANGAPMDAPSGTPGPRAGLKPQSRPRVPGLGSRPSTAPLPPPPPPGRPVFPPARPSAPLDESLPVAGMDDSLLPSLGPTGPGGFGGRDAPISAGPRNPLEDSLVLPGGIPRDSVGDSMLPTFDPGQARNPPDESMLIPGAGQPPARGPIDDSLIIPKGARGPIDDSLVLPGTPDLSRNPYGDSLVLPGGIPRDSVPDQDMLEGEPLPVAEEEVPHEEPPPEDDLRAPPRPRSPLEDEDDLLAPPKPRSPLDAPRPKPKYPPEPTPKPRRRPNSPF